MPEIKYSYISKGSDGYYRVTAGSDISVTCDVGELDETIDEIRSMMSELVA